MARKLCVEFIGTFFLILTIGLTVVGAVPGSPALALAPLAIGSMLMVMVYAGGHISGAHYNPAVTLAVLVRGKCSAIEAVFYVITQIVAGCAAAAAIGILKDPVLASAVPVAFGPAFLVEFLFTFALAYVVLNVATARGTEGNSNYGLAIGFTVTSGVYAADRISGGALNPAVAVGVTLMGISSWASLATLISAELLGGAAAGTVFNLLRLDLDKPTNVDFIQDQLLAGAAETGSSAKLASLRK